MGSSSGMITIVVMNLLKNVADILYATDLKCAKCGQPSIYGFYAKSYATIVMRTVSVSFSVRL